MLTHKYSIKKKKKKALEVFIGSTQGADVYHSRAGQFSVIAHMW